MLFASVIGIVSRSMLNKGINSYLYDAATAGGYLHRLQEDGVGVLAAAGEDDSATPARPGRSRRDELRRSIAAQTVSIALSLRHCKRSSSSSSFRNKSIRRICLEISLGWSFVYGCHLQECPGMGWGVWTFLKHQRKAPLLIWSRAVPLE